MKNALTRFAAILLFVSVLAFSSCTLVPKEGKQQPEAGGENAVLKEEQATKTNYAEDPADSPEYNEYGKFYEKTENDLLFFDENVAVSSLSRFTIGVLIDDESIVSEITTNYGQLYSASSQESGNMLALASGEKCIWGYYVNLGEDGQFPIVYVTVTVKKDGNAIAYGLIKITSLIGEDGHKVVKFATIPQVNGEAQTVTDEQIQAAVEALKND